MARGLVQAVLRNSISDLSLHNRSVYQRFWSQSKPPPFIAFSNTPKIKAPLGSYKSVHLVSCLRLGAIIGFRSGLSGHWAPQPTRFASLQLWSQWRWNKCWRWCYWWLGRVRGWRPLRGRGRRPLQLKGPFVATANLRRVMLNEPMLLGFVKLFFVVLVQFNFHSYKPPGFPHVFPSWLSLGSRCSTLFIPSTKSVWQAQLCGWMPLVLSLV